MELQIKGKTLVKCVLEKGETEVVVPARVRIIGQGAFYGCTNMRSVLLPDKLEEIVAYAFEGCKSLKTISLPSGLSKIGMGAFVGCESLANESGMVIIRDTLYGYYGDDEEIVVPEGVIVLGAYAFSKRTISQITLPESVKHIDSNCFEKCKKLEKVILPAGLISIGIEAFRECVNLDEITLPSKLQLIELNAFSDCKKLSVVEIPPHVTEIKEYAFSGCNRLKSIHFQDREGLICVGKYLDGTDIMLPSGWLENDKIKVLNGMSCVKSISLPDYIEEISTNAFSRCRNLLAATLPANLKRIPNFNEWYSPFSKCEKLRYVVIPSEFSIANSKNPKTIDYAFLVMAKKDGIPFFFMKNTPDELAIPLRKPSCYAFAAMIADGVEIKPQIQAAYKEYIKKNKSKFKVDADQHYGMKELLG